MAEANSRKSEPGRCWTGVIGPWAFCLLSPAFCLLPAGCTPDDFATNDPLIGGGPPVRPPTAAAVGPIQPVAGVVPPLPQTAPSGTPAALTGAGAGRSTRHAASCASARHGRPTWQASGGGPGGVALQPPQPITGGAVPLQPKPAPEAQVTGNASRPTYEQLWAAAAAARRLANRHQGGLQDGRTDRKLLVPNKTDPAKQQRYDVMNARDPVSAMQALLEKIDKGR